jgi:hypothetical protein
MYLIFWNNFFVLKYYFELVSEFLLFTKKILFYFFMDYYRQNIVK